MRQRAPAAALAAEKIARVRDSIAGRYRLTADFYHAAPRRIERYGRAELSFLRRTITRGVLNTPSAGKPGSRWWRAVNERLLQDKVEAGLLYRGTRGSPSSRGVELWTEFIRRPSAASWYRAHNASVVTGYLDHEPLTASELPAERFMMNVTLLRVFYAHALAAAPRLALGIFAPAGRLLGDPRRGAVDFFLDLRQVFPQVYPLDGWRLEDFTAADRTAGRRFAHFLDHGVIAPRLPDLYDFAASSLDQPMIKGLLHDGAPCYAWSAGEHPVWTTGPTYLLPRLAAFATRPRPDAAVAGRAAARPAAEPQTGPVGST
jgi:hypothetical protein